MKGRVKNILDYKIIMKLFMFTRQSWNNWKKEKRPIILLVEKYFTNEDLQEFLDTGKIKRLEDIDFINYHELKKRVGEIEEILGRMSK